MPIYVYTCTHCGAKFERIQPVDHPTYTRCDCGKLGHRDVIQPTSFRMGKTNGKPGLEDLPPAGEWIGEKP